MGGAKLTDLDEEGEAVDPWPESDSDFDLLEGKPLIQGLTATPHPFPDPWTLPPREWAYGRHLIRGEATMTAAPGGVGKSSLMTAEAVAMATGNGLLGPVPEKPLNVWVISGEDNDEEMQRHIAALCQHYGISADDCGGRLFVNVVDRSALSIASQDRDGLHIHTDRSDALIAEITSKRIDVVIVDPLISTHSVSENDNPAMDAVVKEWKRVAIQANAAIHLVHHTRKGGGELDTESVRGAKAVTDAMRAVRVLNRMTDDEAEKAGVKTPWLHFRANLSKTNYAPPPERAEWFKLESVELPNGDNVGVVVPWKWPDAFEAVTPDHTRRVQQVIDGKNLRKDPRAKDWVGYEIAEVLGLEIAEGRNRQMVIECLSTWLKNGVLKAESITDKNRNRVEIINVGEWI